MPVAGLVFVTARNADYRKLNYLLLRLRDWDISPNEDMFMIVTTTNGLNLEATSDEVEATEVPLDHDLDNPWAGASIQDVEGFLVDINRAEPEEHDASHNLYILVDDEGLENETCIMAERIIDFEDEAAPRTLNSYKKMRIPWDEANQIWNNLFIANLSFEDFADDSEDDGSTTREWYTFGGLGGEPVYSDEGVAKRDAEVEKLRADGKI